MGQIVSLAAKPKRCNLNQLNQVPTPAAGEHILVSSDNSMNTAGQGNFDCYIVGDGTTAATALELKSLVDDGIFDISEYHATGNVLAKYADLAATLDGGNNIPKAFRKGGMSVKFVRSSDNKYVQYFLTKDEWSASENDWEKVNLEEEVGQLAQRINEEISEIYKEEIVPETFTFPGAGGYISFSPITLSEEGDALEFNLLVDSVSILPGMAFATNNGLRAISISTSVIGAMDTSGTWLAGMDAAGQGEWNVYRNEGFYLNQNTIKFLVEGGNLKLYIDGTLCHTEPLATSITIDKIGGGYSTYYWKGEIHSFLYTHNGQTTPIYKLPGYVVSGDVTFTSHTEKTGVVAELVDDVEAIDQQIDDALPTLQTKANMVTGISEQSTNDTYPSAKAVFDYSKKANDVAGKLNPLLDTFDLLHPYAIFNGTNSAASITQVDLTSNGDYLEIELFPDASIASPASFGLVNWSTNQVSVGASQTNIWVRGNDSSRTWVASGVSIRGTKAHYILKVLFDDNKIKIYVDGTLIHTYDGQVKISLKYWGLYSSGSNYYWKGKIGYINVNGNVNYITDLPGYNGNIKSETDYGFLTEAQARILAQSGDYPNIFISATSSSVDVYNKVHDNIYVKFTINHQVNLSTGQLKYKDLWRIASQGDFCVYNGESFSSLGIKLLVSAENEFAIKFAGFLDFTGGYHGYERIDVDPSCYCVFVLDGKEYTISDLVSLGDVNGNSFEYRQKSFCYTDSGYSQSPIHFANHVKRTLFECGGFVTRNYFEIILDDLSVSSLTAESAFEGLVCVSEDCADKVVGVDGTIYSTTHPTTSVILVNNINKTSRFVKMFNGLVSCCLDAKMIGTSVSGYDASGNRVQIMDRADDTKYYAYLPSNVAWGDGDAMEVECVVKYDYRPSN